MSYGTSTLDGEAPLQLEAVGLRLHNQTTVIAVRSCARHAMSTQRGAQDVAKRSEDVKKKQNHIAHPAATSMHKCWKKHTRKNVENVEHGVNRHA